MLLKMEQFMLTFLIGVFLYSYANYGFAVIMVSLTFFYYFNK